MDTDGVRGGEELVQVHQTHPHLLGQRLVGEGVVGNHGAAQAQQQFGQQPADGAEAQDAYRAARRLAGDVFIPAAGFNAAEAVGTQLPAAGQDQRQRHLGHSAGVGSGGAGHGNPMAGGGGQVHLVVAYAEADQQGAFAVDGAENLLSVGLYIDQAHVGLLQALDDLSLVKGLLRDPAVGEAFFRGVGLRPPVQLIKYGGGFSEEGYDFFHGDLPFSVLV